MLISGWMENRLRMVTACFLVKSMMLDWRELIPVLAEIVLDLTFRIRREILQRGVDGFGFSIK